MNDISVDIRDMLEAETDLVFVTDLFINNLPDKPINAVAIYTTSGANPDTMLDRFRMENPTFQVLVRHISYLEADNLSRGIMNVLHSKSNELWNDSYYQYILLMSGPTPIGRQQQIKENKQGEIIMAMNFTVKRSEKM